MRLSPSLKDEHDWLTFKTIIQLSGVVKFPKSARASQTGGTRWWRNKMMCSLKLINSLTWADLGQGKVHMVDLNYVLLDLQQDDGHP